ncbi:MAG: hypothetical protein PHU25_20285 [Deltaproteobacteria bacterium]|nr:hypothetical protein [Deltaproteobacteria bacterium]
MNKPSSRWAVSSAVFFLLIGSSLVSPSRASATDLPILDVLFVSNGYFPQERAIEEHLQSLGAFNIVRKKDCQIKGNTDLGSYDLIVLTGFSPLVSTPGINRIKASGVPVLVVEPYGFWYSWRLGLVTTPFCGYVFSRQVESTGPGLDDVSRYLGDEPEVYSRRSAVCGAPSEHLAPGVEPLMYSSKGRDEVAVLLDAQRGFAATSLSETQRYTGSAWQMFDMLLASIVDIGPAWGDAREMLGGLEESGILDYVDGVLADPDAYTEDEVRQTVWGLLIRWNLVEMASYVQGILLPDFEIIGPFVPMAPSIHHPRCKFPNDKWMFGQAWYGDPTNVANGGCTPHYYPDCPRCSHMGPGADQPDDSKTGDWPQAVIHDYQAQHDALVNVYRPSTNSYYVRGTDMGTNVVLNGERFFYMGDTWGWRADCKRPNGQRCSTVENPPGDGAWRVFMNDAVAISHDNYLGDGVDLSVALSARTSIFSPVTGEMHLANSGFSGVGVDGVHFDAWDSSYWANPDYPAVGLPVNEPQFGVPDGATVVRVRSPFLSPVGRVPRDFPMVVLWYATASMAAPGATEFLATSENTGNWDNCATKIYDCSIADSRKTPRSWMACSFDGVHFRNCYPRVNDNFVPFSADDFKWDECGFYKRKWTWDQKTRFFSTSAVYVTAADMRAVCPQGTYNNGSTDPTTATSPLCELGGAFTDGSTQEGGLLLYGVGRPGGASPLFMAFLETKDIGALHDSGSLRGRPVVHYFVGLNRGSTLFGGPTSWSYDEQDAIPLPDGKWQDGWPCEDKQRFHEGNVVDGYEDAINYLYFGDSLDPSDVADFRQHIDEKLSDPNLPVDEKNALVFYKDHRRYQYCSALPGAGSEGAMEFSPETCMLDLSRWWNDTVSLKSVRLLKKGDAISRILMVYNRPAGPSYMVAALKQPWDLSEPLLINSDAQDPVLCNHGPYCVTGNCRCENAVNGYGLFIIGDESDIIYDDPDHNGKGDLIFWLTVSTWKGAKLDGDADRHPYGVYTTKVRLPWPSLIPIPHAPLDPLGHFPTSSAWAIPPAMPDVSP